MIDGVKVTQLLKIAKAWLYQQLNSGHEPEKQKKNLTVERGKLETNQGSF